MTFNMESIIDRNKKEYLEIIETKEKLREFRKAHSDYLDDAEYDLMWELNTRLCELLAFKEMHMAKLMGESELERWAEAVESDIKNA